MYINEVIAGGVILAASILVILAFIFGYVTGENHGANNLDLVAKKLSKRLAADRAEDERLEKVAHLASTIQEGTK